MRHIFACPAGTGIGWIIYRRDARGWGESELRGGIKEVVEYDLRDALQFSIDLTGYGRVTQVEEKFAVKWRGPHSKWSVIRTADGSVVKQGFDAADSAQAFALTCDARPGA